MAKEDKTLVCADCNREFIWSASEQAFFEKKGFKEIPKRCPDCRKYRREEKGFEVKCQDCAKTTTLSFAPDKETVYLCEECAKKRASKS